MLVFTSTKTYDHNIGLSCCFRQHKATSHCKYLHGYALKVKLVFEGDLNDKNWVMDFGALKPVKSWFEDVFDHKTLVAKDDPHLEVMNNLHKLGVIDIVVVDATGCESFAQMIFFFVDSWLQVHYEEGYRVKLQSVEVSEHVGNSAIATRDSRVSK